MIVLVAVRETYSCWLIEKDDSCVVVPSASDPEGFEHFRFRFKIEKRKKRTNEDCEQGLHVSELYRVRAPEVDPSLIEENDH